MTMRVRLGFLGLIVAAVIASAPVRAEQAKSAGDIDPAFRKSIVTLIEKTGVMNISQQMYKAIVAQLLPALNKQYGIDGDKIQKVMQEEMTASFDRHLDTFKEMVISIYATYFTKKDIDAINAFYDSPTGKKVIATLPEITQESMKAGQVFGQAFASKAMQNVKHRLDAMKSEQVQ